MLDAKILRSVIEGSGAKFEQNTVSYIFDCPRCSKESKLFLRKKDGWWICWYCAERDGTRGKDPVYILPELLGVPRHVVANQLYGIGQTEETGELSIVLEGFEPDEWDEEAFYEVPSLIDLPAIRWPFEYYPIDHPNAARGAEYLEGRGISLDVAKQYGIRYNPPERRVSFPASYAGSLYGYQDRAVFPVEYFDEETGELFKVPKALSSKSQEDFNWRNRMVMFMDRLTGSDHVILTEGPISALKAHLCGGNVATLGKMVSQTQLDIIRKLGIRKLYLALDPDAFIETMKLIYELDGEMEVYHMEVPPGVDGQQDLGDLTMDHAYELYRSARRADTNTLLIHLS